VDVQTKLEMLEEIADTLAVAGMCEDVTEQQLEQELKRVRETYADHSDVERSVFLFSGQTA
jgi:hypothetical protein